MTIASRRLTATFAMLAACVCGSAAAQSVETPRSFEDYEGDPRLGTQVDRVCSAAAIDTFESPTRDTVLVEAGAAGWYLVRTHSCSGLENAHSIRLNRFGACLNDGDGVTPMDGFIPGSARPLEPNHVRSRRSTQLPSCRIREIYEWSPGAVTTAAL